MRDTTFRFSHFEMKVASYELLRAGERVRIERIPMDLLILLVENRGSLVSRELIIEKLWGKDVFVETEHSINTAINKLRVVLKDRPRDPVFIQTVIGKGYRFIAEVEVLEEYPPAESAQRTPLAPVAVAIEPAFEPASSGEISKAEETKLLTAGESASPAVSEDWPPPPYGAEPLATIPSSPVAGSAVWKKAGAAVLLSMLLVWIAHELQRRRSPVTPSIRSVAVLPFSDLSGSPGQDYLVDGMTDEVITLLARSTSLRVISRRSTMQYKNVQKPLAQIAADLKVDAVVEGSVMRSGRDVRITAQLLDAARDRHLWAQTYLDNSSEPLLNQDSVAADIARQVALTLTQKPLAISEQAIDPRAHELFLRARYLSNTRTLDALRRSIDYYKQAIQMDPKFAEAYAALGESYVVLSSYGGPDPPEMLQEARVAATRALAIKSDLGEAHTVLAAVKVDLDWDWTGAEAEFHRAIELNFGDATAHHWYGLHLARMRRFDEAQAELRTALSLDPLSVILETDVAEVAYYAHQPERAEKELLRALELDPHFADAHSVLGKVYEEKGDFPRALQEFRTASQLFGETPGSRALIAHALALSGRREEARKITRELEAERRRYISSVDIALVDCALKDNDRAMFWLEHGFQNRDKGMDVLGVEPLFDSCRADKRFQDLVKRLKL